MNKSERMKPTFPEALQAGAALLSAALLLVMPALPQETTAQTPVPQKPVPLKLKSESLALGLSALGTGLPLCILLAAGIPLGNSREEEMPAYLTMAFLTLTAGPSVGYFYGGVPGPAWKGILIRTALFCGSFSFVSNELLASVCVLGLFASVVWDILSVRFRVHEHNLELQRKALAIAPIIYPGKNGVGVGIRIQFSF